MRFNAIGLSNFLCAVIGSVIVGVNYGVSIGVACFLFVWALLPVHK